MDIKRCSVTRAALQPIAAPAPHHSYDVRAAWGVRPASSDLHLNPLRSSRRMAHDGSQGLTIYEVSRPRRAIELLRRPWLAILWVAIMATWLPHLIPLVPEGIDFLRQGGVAWIAAAPVVIVFPFLAIYTALCLRAVALAWIDALSGATATLEGAVGYASSTPFQFMVGQTFISATANHLSIDRRLFESLPTAVMRTLQVGDRLRVTYAPRTNYVVSIARLA